MLGMVAENLPPGKRNVLTRARGHGRVATMADRDEQRARGGGDWAAALPRAAGKVNRSPIMPGRRAHRAKLDPSKAPRGKAPATATHSVRAVQPPGLEPWDVMADHGGLVDVCSVSENPEAATCANCRKAREAR
jgi:hypothetical protein